MLEDKKIGSFCNIDSNDLDVIFGTTKKEETFVICGCGSVGRASVMSEAIANNLVELGHSIDDIILVGINEHNMPPRNRFDDAPILEEILISRKVSFDNFVDIDIIEQTRKPHHNRYTRRANMKSRW